MMKPVERQGQQASIRGMFSAIAGHYDLMKTLMSLGQDQRWRTEALKLLQMKESGKLLDLACGSGEVALQAKRLYSDVQVVGMDLTLDMLRIAIKKDKRQLVGWGAGDALSLPFADNTFDGLISAFLMRNVGDIRQALSEQVRWCVRGAGVVLF